MSTTVVQMSAFLARVGSPRVSDADFVRMHVKDELRGLSLSRIAQAQARALRLVASHMPADQAIKRAIAWARCAVDPNDPLPPQAA